MISNVDMRLVYENAANALQKAFPELKQDIRNICKLTQSTIRLEQPIVAGVTSYEFPILANQPVFSNTEQRLLQQDSAVIYQVGFFTGAPASSTDTKFTPDCYNSPVKYGANADALLAAWNGSNLSIAVNNDILVPNWDLWKHYNAPQTQQTATLGSGFPQDENEGATYGFYPMEPNIVCIGSKNTVIRVTMPVGISPVLPNSRLILIMRCVIAQNSTVVS